jgi:hypothetical protein
MHTRDLVLFGFFFVVVVVVVVDYVDDVVDQRSTCFWVDSCRACCAT